MGFALFCVLVWVLQGGRLVTQWVSLKIYAKGGKRVEWKSENGLLRAHVKAQKILVLESRRTYSLYILNTYTYTRMYVIFMGSNVWSAFYSCIQSIVESCFLSYAPQSSLLLRNVPNADCLLWVISSHPFRYVIRVYSLNLYYTIYIYI